MRVLIAGATGLIGTALKKFFESSNHEVFTLVRDKNKATKKAIYWNLDEKTKAEELGFFENMDLIINLAGENIASGRWSEAKKKAILESRLKVTEKLVSIILELKNPPKLLINASAIGYYGDRGEELLLESSEPGHIFLSEVCKDWEKALRPLSQSNVRVVILRTSAVLAKEGGAFSKMLPAFKFGLGGNLGSGEQYFSFISLEDLVRIVDYVVSHEEIQGPINVSTPNPITNKTFTKALGKALNRPTFFQVPAFIIRLIFGQMGEEVLLSSAKVYPKKLLDAGFQFKYPTIEETIKECLK